MANASLSDGIVTLRPADAGDRGAIEVGLHDPEVVRWLGQPRGRAIDVMALNEQRWADGSPTLAITEAAGDCVGLVWVNRHRSDRSIGYVGYWLLPSARGRGLATRAVRLITRWAIQDLGVTRLRLLVEPGNGPSQRVAEQAGFRRVELLPGHGAVDDRKVDLVLYELPADRD